MINIHPDAQNNFNERAQKLISCIKTISPFPIHNKAAFTPDFHTVHHFTDKDIIGDLKISAVDFRGKQIAFYFRDGQKQMSIQTDDYNSLRKLAENMFKIKDVGQSLALETIEQILCDWIKEKYFNKDLISFTNYFIAKANDLITDLSLWAPISYLCVQEPFRLGKVHFRQITKAMIDKWGQQWIGAAPEKEEEINKIVDKDLRPLQGYAAATLDLRAEKERAKEILIEEATKSISFLRIFTGSALHPEITSFCGLRGSTHTDGLTLIYFKDKEDFVGMSDEIVGPSPTPQILTNNDIAKFFQLGLGTIDRLLNSESLSSFCGDVLDALLLYSRAGTSKDVADKLVYMLAALESILLKNSSEPIQQNLGERLAFLIGENVEDRKNIISNVRDVYRLRSAFVHHGTSIDDLKTLEIFMLNVWVAVIRLISVTDHFKTKNDFISSLDDRKLA
jgi:hypothetical protein